MFTYLFRKNALKGRFFSMQNFNHSDPFLFENQLTTDEKMIRDTAHDYSQQFLLPVVKKYFRNENFDIDLMKEMGRLGLLGATIKDYGCSGVNYVSYGLIMREIERVEWL